MNKDKKSKEAQVHDNKIDKLAESSYQFHGNAINQKTPEPKKQKWILVNNQGQFSGILDHSDYGTRERAKAWFQRTSLLSGSDVNIDELYYVLKAEEYEFLKELDALDKLDAINMISNLDIN